MLCAWLNLTSVKYLVWKPLNWHPDVATRRIVGVNKSTNFIVNRRSRLLGARKTRRWGNMEAWFTHQRLWSMPWLRRFRIRPPQSLSTHRWHEVSSKGRCCELPICFSSLYFLNCAFYLSFLDRLLSGVLTTSSMLREHRIDRCHCLKVGGGAYYITWNIPS